jgi:hypothetical protein
MVPTEWLEFSTLPKNANGKVDRPFLKNEFQNRSANLVRQPANNNKNMPEPPAPRTIRPSEHHD